MTAALLLMAACGDDDGASGQSDEPPWGLTGIALPDTEAEVIAVLQAMPAIDGHQPSFSMDEDLGFPSVFYYQYEEVEGGEVDVVWVGISAVPEPEPLMVYPNAWNIEASTGDPDSDLLWTVGPFADEEDTGLIWAASDGSWMFFCSADTAEFRRKLIDAFVAAAS